jgi:hypothetical protein
MDKKEFFGALAITTFMLFITGCIVGIVLNLTGYTHINVTSWRYWLGFSSLLIPIFLPIILRSYNISMTSILGQTLTFYGSAIMGIMLTTCILERSLEWWPTLVYVTIFSILYPIFLFIAEHPLVKSKVDAVKSKFSRK